MNTLNHFHTPPVGSPHEHLTVIRASGADAALFLHGQLSNDFLLLPTNQWQLAAYCSPKGRMLASFWGIKLVNTPELQEIYLVLSKDILSATLKRLSMFVLRAKVTLTEELTVLPDLFANHGLANWAEHEVVRGVARINAPLVDLFVPQMLNYESIGGVSFKKGCYPGQEVVARSQFRGAIKRRTYLVDAPTCAAGQEVFATNSDESVGLVIQSSQGLALICIQTSSAQSQLRLGTPDGAHLVLRDLPYALKDDI